jgi:hypothetical protein
MFSGRVGLIVGLLCLGLSNAAISQEKLTLQQETAKEIEEIETLLTAYEIAVDKTRAQLQGSSANVAVSGLGLNTSLLLPYVANILPKGRTCIVLNGVGAFFATTLVNTALISSHDAEKLSAHLNYLSSVIEEHRVYLVALKKKKATGFDYLELKALKTGLELDMAKALHAELSRFIQTARTTRNIGYGEIGLGTLAVLSAGATAYFTRNASAGAFVARHAAKIGVAKRVATSLGLAFMVEGSAVVYFTRDELISLEDQLDQAKAKIDGQQQFLENLKVEIEKRKK